VRLPARLSWVATGESGEPFLRGFLMKLADSKESQLEIGREQIDCTSC
jgi:hypothetical protein